MLYQRGIIMNLSNPKVLLFFFAFLPQFTHSPAGRVGLQTVQLGAVFILAALLVFGAIAFSREFSANCCNAVSRPGVGLVDWPDSSF